MSLARCVLVPHLKLSLCLAITGVHILAARPAMCSPFTISQSDSLSMQAGDISNLVFEPFGTVAIPGPPLASGESYQLEAVNLILSSSDVVIEDVDVFTFSNSRSNSVLLFASGSVGVNGPGDLQGIDLSFFESTSIIRGGTVTVDVPAFDNSSDTSIDSSDIGSYLGTNPLDFEISLQIEDPTETGIESSIQSVGQKSGTVSATLTYTYIVVPEPSTLMLTLAGLAMVAWPITRHIRRAK